MTVKVDSDGDFVQTVDSLESNVVSDLYDILSKSETSIGTVAHEVRKGLDVPSDSDEDIAQWCSLINNVSIVESNDNHDGTLGAAFYYTTSYSANDYTGYSGKYSSINTEPLGDGELSHQKDFLVDEGIVNSEQTVEVPVTSDGDILPVIAVSNEKDASHPTFEEAEETLQKLIDSHFEEVEVVEASNNDGEESDSDESEDFLLSGASGVGSEVSEKIKTHIVENQITVDWREHIEADSDDWRTTVVTETEAKRRLQEVAIDMDPEDFGKASDLISDGHIDQAMMAIEKHE